MLDQFCHRTLQKQRVWQLVVTHRWRCECGCEWAVFICDWQTQSLEAVSCFLTGSRSGPTCSSRITTSQAVESAALCWCHSSEKGTSQITKVQWETSFEPWNISAALWPDLTARKPARQSQWHAAREGVAVCVLQSCKAQLQMAV